RQRQMTERKKAPQPIGEGGISAAQIRSGYSANANIVLAEVKHALTIPESAIEFSEGKTFVYVIKGEGKKKEYERRSVKTGLSDGIRIEILSGITKNDLVRGPKIISTEEDGMSIHQ
ncbi:MAG: hypothetical protein IKX69_04820, partial [Prevotella sp.]|nr:hypothetical protein [Prevotella sp.]